MNRPVAASAVAEAAEKAPHAIPIQTRRETNGDVSSGTADFFFAAAARAEAAATEVVLPAILLGSTAGEADGFLAATTSLGLTADAIGIEVPGVCSLDLDDDAASDPDPVGF
jgi:hypothetical protein